MRAIWRALVSGSGMTTYRSDGANGKKVIFFYTINRPLGTRTALHLTMNSTEQTAAENQVIGQASEVLIPATGQGAGECIGTVAALAAILSLNRSQWASYATR